MTGPSQRAGGLVGLALLAGCADRGLVSGPARSTSIATTGAVAAAGLLAGAVLTALVLVRTPRTGGARLASLVLAAQSAALTLATAVLTGAAVRGDQLLDRPDDAEQAASLLRLTGLDGREAEFFQLMAAAVVVLGLLAIALTVLAARCATGHDPTERLVATLLLGTEALASAGALAFVALGDRGQVVVASAALLPLLVAATWSAWPRATPLASEGAGTGGPGRVQRRHG